MYAKKDLLEMTFSELENVLTSLVSSLNEESSSDSELRNKMIDHIRTYFHKDVELYTSYYTGREISVIISGLHIIFGVSLKRTGKTEKISRLKRADIKAPKGLKFKEAIWRLGYFWYESESTSEKSYKVIQKGDTSTDESCVIKNKKIPIKKILTGDFLLKEIESQSSNSWKSIREGIVLMMAQPFLKKFFFTLDKTQEEKEREWNEIIRRVEEDNKELIEKTIEKYFTF